MKIAYIVLAIALSAVITLALRSLPFVVFREGRKMPETVLKLGQVLPATIMAVLIVYCVKDVSDNWTGIGIPKLLAVLIVGISYKWKHNTFFSIAAGTVAYMILLHVFAV